MRCKHCSEELFSDPERVEGREEWIDTRWGEAVCYPHTQPVVYHEPEEREQ
jgi:hypothetical protein